MAKLLTRGKQKLKQQNKSRDLLCKECVILWYQN